MEANWVRWEEEKPKWFNEGTKARIPVEYIPTAAGRSKERGRRASVVAEDKKVEEGALRESMRSASIELRGNIVRVVPSS